MPSGQLKGTKKSRLTGLLLVLHLSVPRHVAPQRVPFF